MTLARLLFLCLSVSLSLWTPSPALAQDFSTSPDVDQKIKARERYEAGRSAFERSDYREAIIDWELAYELSRRAEILYNLSVAHEQLGELEEALQYLQRYRDQAGDHEQDSLKKKIATLESRIDASQPRPRARWSEVHWPTVSLFGGSALALTSGVVFGLQAQKARTTAQSLCRGFEDALVCNESADEWLQRQRGRALAADLSFGVAALTIAGGVVLTLRPDALSSSLQLRLQPNAFTLEGQF